MENNYLTMNEIYNFLKSLHPTEISIFLKKIHLNPNQEIRSAIVFLNTFGLILEEKENLTDTMHLHIFDKENNTVGEVYFENEKVKIEANSNFGFIHANYDFAKIQGFSDIDSPGCPIFMEWQNKINYTIEENNKKKFSGEFLVNNNMDEVYGMNCSCHMTLNYQKQEIKTCN